MPFISIAPMEGVVDWIVRDLLTKIGGIDRAVTEFVRVTDQVLPDQVFLRYCPELKTNGKTAAGTPVFVQLLGGKPDWLAENAKVVEALGAPGIDLNFGCPAKTVNRHDGGATLLQHPHRLFDIISAVKRAVSIPVTAKVRLGFENKDLHLDIARSCSDAGAALMTVHARTKSEGYVPPAHWEYIARMREVVKMPILANGEIWSAKDYATCTRITGVSDVALGRGLVGRPDLALQIKGLAKPFSWIKTKQVYLLPFVAMSLEERGEPFAVARTKQLLKMLSRGFTEAQFLFEQIKTIKSVGEMKPYLEEETCLMYKSTPGPIVLTASAPRIF
jgi:tRNA-dihydrouridine synthase C